MTKFFWLDKYKIIAAIVAFTITIISTATGYGFAVGTLKAKIELKIERLESWALKHQELTEKQIEIGASVQKQIETNSKSIDKLVELTYQILMSKDKNENS